VCSDGVRQNSVIRIGLAGLEIGFRGKVKHQVGALVDQEVVYRSSIPNVQLTHRQTADLAWPKIGRDNVVPRGHEGRKYRAPKHASRARDHNSHVSSMARQLSGCTFQQLAEESLVVIGDLLPRERCRDSSEGCSAQAGTKVRIAGKPSQATGQPIDRIVRII
jgi:hypothetical protein